MHRTAFQPSFYRAVFFSSLIKFGGIGFQTWRILLPTHNEIQAVITPELTYILKKKVLKMRRITLQLSSLGATFLLFLIKFWEMVRQIWRILLLACNQLQIAKTLGITYIQRKRPYECIELLSSYRSTELYIYILWRTIEILDDCEYRWEWDGKRQS